MACNKYTKICGDLDRQVWKIIIPGHRVVRTVHCSFLVRVCVSVYRYVFSCTQWYVWKILPLIRTHCIFLFVRTIFRWNVCLLFGNYNYKQQNPSWKADSFSASQETACIVCNPKFRYHIHKSPPPVLILSLIDITHAPHHFNLILPSIPVSSKLSLSLRIPNRNFVYSSSLPHICHVPSPSHSWFYHPNIIRWGVLFVKLLILSSSPLNSYLVSKTRSIWNTLTPSSAAVMEE
jgi:hypothetical protein